MIARTSSLSALLAASAALAAAAAAAACGATATATGVTPITGIVIRSESLVRGFGCGTAPHQVRKYVAAVASDDAKSAYLYGNVFDCFADGVFSTIPLPVSGNPSFTVLILALNADDYAAQRANVDAIVGAPQGDPTNPVPVGRVTPTWSTTCHATQQANIAVLAVCDPLASPGAGAGDAGADADADAAPSTRIQLETASFPRAEGGSFVCGTDYTTVRALFDQFPMQTGAITCPAPLVIDPAKPNVTYHLDVSLTKGIATVGLATGCTATTVQGQTTVPTCPAFQ